MITLKYWNPNFQVALSDWQSVYQFPQKEKRIKEVYRGSLYYRLRGSSRRISYKQIKQGLQKKQTVIYEEIYLLPF